jgi:hypothetical protein
MDEAQVDKGSKGSRWNVSHLVVDVYRCTVATSLPLLCGAVCVVK